MSGTLFVVATPIGNLDDITARALRVLREVAVIAAEDTRRTAHLLARYVIPTPTTSFHEHNETKKSASLVARLARGDDIALVSDAGTPTISDPGQRLVRAALDAGYRVESIPGPSAVMAALAVSGLPSATFTFLGFPPTRSKARTQWFEKLREAGRTVVFFEAPHRIKETLDQLRVIVGDRPIIVCRELTKSHEELVSGPISHALSVLDEPKGEFTVVVDAAQGTESGQLGEVSDADMLREFGEMTARSPLPRRRALNALARKHRRPPNEVYAAIERAKKLVK
jgi:16S rRNA (cytidine1402-2'-O)-methyltransferase